MSFILDALKKSEAERQRQIAPGLLTPPAVPPRSRLPLWAIALLGLLVLNTIVLSVVIMRHTPDTAAPAVAAVAPVAITTSAPPVAPASVPRDASNDDAPLFAPEVPVAAPNNPIVSAARARLGSAATAAAGAPADEQMLPTIGTMNFTGADALAPLHLDVHVYAADPAARFVFINGRKYTEGSTLVEGPSLVRIRPDGVVLEYRGKRFLLPRQ